SEIIIAWIDTADAGGVRLQPGHPPICFRCGHGLGIVRRTQVWYWDSLHVGRESTLILFPPLPPPGAVVPAAIVHACYSSQPHPSDPVNGLVGIVIFDRTDQRGNDSWVLQFAQRLRDLKNINLIRRVAGYYAPL